MSDDFLAKARADWRASDGELERMAVTLRRKYAWSKIGVVYEMVSGAVAIAAGVFLIAADLAPYNVLARLAGAVLLVAVPILSAAAWFARRAHPKWEDTTPEGVLRYALKRLDVVESLVKIARWNAFVLAGFVAAIWGFAGGGRIPVDWMLLGFTVFYLGIAAASFAWTRWRLRKLAHEREQAKAMLAEYTREAA